MCGTFYFEKWISRSYLSKGRVRSGISFAREFEMPIYYKAQHIGTRRVDFLVEITVELKALIQLEKVHLAQALNYLEAYNLEIGLLINFGSSSLDFRRRNKKFNPRIQ